MRKIISLILSIIIIVSTIMPSTAKTTNYYQIELQSLKQNTKLINYFISLDDTRDDTGINFPDYYGGSYIDENGSLVILITYDEGINQISKIISNVTYKVCKYSYSDLINIISEINHAKLENIKSEIDFFH